MRYSIVVPIYKVEDCLERCVRSVLPWVGTLAELILVDDGSPDCSGEIADRMAEMNPNIKVIHKPNGGLSDARNVGIQAASGLYIILLDSDDYLDLDELKKADDYIQKHPNADIYFGKVRKIQGSNSSLLIKRNLQENIAYTGEDALKWELSSGKFMAMAQCGIYRRDFLLENDLLFKRGILHEDEQWSPRVALAAKQVHAIDAVFYQYVIREGSITQAKDKSRNASDLLCTCEELDSIYEHLQDRKLQQLLRCYNAKLYMRACSVEIRLGKRKKVDAHYVLGRWRTAKDFVRFMGFAAFPGFYAKQIDGRFIK